MRPPSVSMTMTFRPASVESLSCAARNTASYSSVPRGVPLPVTDPVPAPVLMVASVFLPLFGAFVAGFFGRLIGNRDGSVRTQRRLIIED